MHIKEFKDLNFIAVAEPDEYHVEYKIYDVAGCDDDGPRYCFGNESTGSIELAGVYLNGHVKWDGCSNWHFDEQDRVMLHGCRREDLTRLGEVMARCWDWAAELLPCWEG